ncbi:MAG: ribosome-associated translation inhibitor RaiA [Eubacteriales bacterium]
MKMTYTEKKITLPNNVKDYAEKKISKLERYFNGEVEGFVAFGVEKDRNIVEVTIHASSTYFRAKESTSDMFASVDAAVATIEGQIRKNKTKLARRIRQDAMVRSPESISSFIPEAEEGEFEIVRSKRFSMKMMSHDEAILQMNLLGHSFFAFRDEESDGAFAVVYRRKDGGYGIIEDET